MIGALAAVALVAVALTLLATATFVGSRLPVAHRVIRTARYAEPIARVWDAVSDPSTARELGVARIEQAAPVPGRVLVRRVVGDRAFGGTWTFELEPDGSGTRVTVTEDGEIYSPLFRFVARFVLGPTRTVDSYLDSLRRRL